MTLLDIYEILIKIVLLNETLRNSNQKRRLYFELWKMIDTKNGNLWWKAHTYMGMWEKT